ncbi:cysteine hydrolase family protein [Ectobacillus antri]|uniref:cysteine hydrolase family protein n=1 Tax=Ectobacillus antri TaxID=2486280 RepID=UPI000F595D74|nr:cysteine hydrolase family protein [Ectobacillus antri]
MNTLFKNVPLIIIDVQKFFLQPHWGKRNNLDAERNMLRLLEGWRNSQRPVIFIQHISPTPPETWSVRERELREFQVGFEPLPHEYVVTKTVNSSFIDTNLEALLRELAAQNVVIVGLTTNHCVETTTRMAGNMGFSPFLVSDATATFDRIGPDGRLYKAQDIHNMTMVNLHEEFATIVTTEDVLLAL